MLCFKYAQGPTKTVNCDFAKFSPPAWPFKRNSQWLSYHLRRRSVWNEKQKSFWRKGVSYSTSMRKRWCGHVAHWRSRDCSLPVNHGYHINRGRNIEPWLTYQWKCQCAGNCPCSKEGRQTKSPRCGSGTTGRHPPGTRHKIHLACSLSDRRGNMKP